MAKVCAICGKTSVMAGRRKLLRGHYNPTGKVRKYPNLQWFRVTSATAKKLGMSAGSRVLVCTKCRKAASRKTS